MPDLSLQKIAIIPDLHCDDHNRRAVDLACMVLEDVKPDRMIFLGDVLDFGWASHFTVDQTKLTGQFQRERDAWTYVARSLITSAGHPPSVEVLQGNHEFRQLTGFIWRTPALSGLHGLSWGDILYAKNLGVKWVPESEIWLAGGHFLVTHGKIVRKWSAYTAKAEFDDRGSSGASGHTHRMGQYFLTHTATMNVHSWTECGHLSNNPPRYAKPNEGRANWQLGFAVMAASKTEYRLPTLIPFWHAGKKLRARYQDEEYSA